MVDTYQIKRLGYIPDHYSIRDYGPEHQNVAKMYSSIKGLKTTLKAGKEKDTLGPSVDIRDGFTPIMDLGSCTANAGAGLLQYFEKKHINLIQNHQGCSFTKQLEILCMLLETQGPT
jgi:hypothetical protein